MSESSPGLFSPLILHRTRLANRIVMSAVPSGCTTMSGFTNTELTAYYAAHARSGIGMLILEATYVLPPMNDTTPHLGLYDNAHISGMRDLINAIHQADIPVLIMLDQPWPVLDLHSSQIATIGEAFIAAAWRARATGADGIMFSTTDGGPFEQLVSPLQNQRTDRYGTNIEGRLRLLQNVIEEIERWIGSQFIQGVRLTVEEFAVGGLTLQDARVIAKRLTSVGASLFEISATNRHNLPVARFPGWRVPLAAAIKAVIDVPIMVGGQLDDPELADSVIRDGSVDMVTLDEQLRLEPSWPQRARSVLSQRQAEQSMKGIDP